MHRRKEEPKAIRFRDFADEYLRFWGASRKTSTVAREKNRIEHLLNRQFGKKYLVQIKRRDVENFLQDRREAGVTAATVNRDLCRLKNILKKAVERRYLQGNPIRDIKKAREVVRDAEYLTKEEVVKLIATCDVRIRPLLTVAVNTGMRWGEISQLEWGDVHLDKRIITLRDTKNHDTRYVFLNAAAVSVLDEHRKDQARMSGEIERYVFPNPRTKKPYMEIRKQFAAALTARGDPPPHHVPRAQAHS